MCYTMPLKIESLPGWFSLPNCKSSGVVEERSLFFFLFINIFITTASIAVGVEVSRIGDMKDKDHQGAAITMVLFVLMNLPF